MSEKGCSLDESADALTFSAGVRDTMEFAIAFSAPPPRRAEINDRRGERWNGENCRQTVQLHCIQYNKYVFETVCNARFGDNLFILKLHFDSPPPPPDSVGAH